MRLFRGLKEAERIRVKLFYPRNWSFVFYRFFLQAQGNSDSEDPRLIALLILDSLPFWYDMSHNLQDNIITIRKFPSSCFFFPLPRCLAGD
jgi:hypothetical protein